MTEEMKNQDTNVNADKLKFGRRDFLKAAGITTAVGAAAGAINLALPKQALAAYEEPNSFGVDMSVKYLDKPPYDLPPYAGGSDLKPYNQGNAAFYNRELTMSAFGGKDWRYAMMGKQMEKIKNGEGGFSVRDIAFESGAGFSWDMPTMHTWGTDFQSMTATAFGKWDEGPEQNSLTVKKAANFYGSGATGICELNRNWIYAQTMEGKPYKFVDIATPVINETEFLIPNSINRAIVFLIPMDGEVNKFTPSMFSGGAPSLGYSKMSELVSKVAQFIRQLGYNAIPCGNDTGLSVPMAIDAGLGELGRHGLLINPEYGTNMRICKVLTDMPLAVDQPITFGAAEFCKTCKKCAIHCPSKSIPTEEEPSTEVACGSNNPGMTRWYVNTWTCLQFWVENGGPCSVCMRNCTYSKPKTWVHDVVKVVASKTTAFNSIFSKMDEAFGYGKTWDSYTKADIDDWWSSPTTRNFNWTKM